MKTILLYSILILTLIVSLSSKTPKINYWIKEKDNPGIQFIDTEFGIDRTEITNFHWCEFLYWTERMYGKNSEQYKSILPDSTVWSDLDTAYQKLDEFDHYLRHPGYRDYPVVGVNYQQAEKYCAWRSDRVFEYLMIREKYWSFAQSIECDTSNFVTIDRYERGELEDIPRNSKINRLPYYHLPSEKEWYKAMKYNEQKMLTLSKRHQKLLKKASGTSIWKNNLVMCGPVYEGHRKFSSRWIFYLDRNVSELLSDGKSAIGNNWGGNQSSGVFPVTDISKVYVGFRCAFEWKKPISQDSH